MAVRHKLITSFIIGQLFSLLEDEEWLLWGSDTLLKVRDEMLLGVYFDRSRWQDIFYVEVFVRPLYWPPEDWVFGLCSGMGPGWELTSDRRRASAANEIASLMNRQVIPLFSELRTARDVVAHSLRHPNHPVTGIARRGWDTVSHEVLGYMAAWSGRRILASILLRAASKERRADDDESKMLRTHVKQTLHLLSRPGELHDMLQQTADRVRRSLRLECARPIRDVRERRGGPMSGGGPDPGV